MKKGKKMCKENIDEKMKRKWYCWGKTKFKKERKKKRKKEIVPNFECVKYLPV